jgi:hypothetical protein
MKGHFYERNETLLHVLLVSVILIEILTKDMHLTKRIMDVLVFWTQNTHLQ